jgi:hypothetical protein
MLIIFLCLSFVSGFFWGFFIKSIFSKYDKMIMEKEIYCKGFENGIYYCVGEKNPELFKIKVAENSFKEHNFTKIRYKH